MDTLLDGISALIHARDTGRPSLHAPPPHERLAREWEGDASTVVAGTNDHPYAAAIISAYRQCARRLRAAHRFAN